MENAFELFETDEKALKGIMGQALKRGGDYGDIYYQHQETRTMVLEDNQVSQAFSTVDRGVGIRVLKGDQTGYSYTEDLASKAIKQAAHAAATIADGPASSTPNRYESLKLKNYYPLKTPWEDEDISSIMNLLTDLNEKLFTLDTRIIKVRINFVSGGSSILIMSSDGKISRDFRPGYRVGISCTAEQDGRIETNSLSRAGRAGTEVLIRMDWEQIAREAVNSTVELFNARGSDGGEMEVVLGPGSSGILLHEAIGHGLEADFNRKGTSIFSNQMNQRVADPQVTIVDDGTLEGAFGSINVDDENTESQNTVLVEKGILKSYMHDRISAKHYRVQPTGNGRRQSFRHEPYPRMRNTYMLPGPHTREDIIKSVKKGLYADTFANGQVLIGAGDFTFYVKQGWIIEGGKLSYPVKDVNIIGNGPEVLKNIQMVGNDLAMSQWAWTCGKNGQGVPVSLGLPTVKISSINVGGSNGK